MSNDLKGFIEDLEKFNELLEGTQREEGLVDTLKSLLRSRKVLLAVAGATQTIVAHYLNVPPEVWAAIDGLIVAVIGAIAHEDAAEKRGSG